MTPAPDRHDGVVSHVDVFYCFALYDVGESSFRVMLPAKNFQVTGHYGFAHVRVGTLVRFILIDGPKGPRGIEVQILEV